MLQYPAYTASFFILHSSSVLLLHYFKTYFSFISTLLLNSFFSSLSQSSKSLHSLSLSVLPYQSASRYRKTQETSTNYGPAPTMPIWQNPSMAAGTSSMANQTSSTHDGGTFFEGYDGFISSTVTRPLDLFKSRYDAEHHNRTSFSSVKEDEGTCISQSFKETKFSSYSKQGNEEAIDDNQDGMLT